MWSIFRSLAFTSVFLLIQTIIPLYFTHAWIHLDLVFALLLAIWWFCFGFGLWKWKKAKLIVSSWVHEKLNFSGKSNFLPLLWQLLIHTNCIHDINLLKISNMKYFDKKVTEKVWKKLCYGWSWQNEDKNMGCSFFKWSLIFGAQGLKLELSKVSISNLSSNCRAWALKLSEHLKKQT